MPGHFLAKFDRNVTGTSKCNGDNATPLGFGRAYKGGIMYSFRVSGGDICRILLVLLLVAVVNILRPSATAAQTCGTEYKIKEGDTLAQIAARVYGNPTQWTVIFYANQDRLGTNASLLVPGLAIALPCIGGAPPPTPPAAPEIPTPPQQAPSPTTDAPIHVFIIVRRLSIR